MTERVKATCRQCGEIWDICYCSSWPLSQIVYSRHQVFCIMHNFGALPLSDDPGAERTQKQKTSGAPGETMLCVIAELEVRLKSCGEAGEALQDEAPTVETMGQLSRPAMRALNYCSGWRRRRQSYAQWKVDQNRKYTAVKAAPSVNLTGCGKLRS